MEGDHALREMVLDVLRHVAPDADLDRLNPAQTFRDQLGIDSIDFLNFVAGLEERLGLRIAELDYPRLSTLDGCLDYIAAASAGRRDARAS